ncbi:MAG: FadR family transcriptional regulator [Candidatus Eremiobacteraeota bacterium]|nr:FadR family transcriptional regulator [Candidatus Eremiobacteraeota bacterium]MBV8354585.1 FadR family transcriptional regulator [Candidatus Eremiobacteraeota bacterium]
MGVARRIVCGEWPSGDVLPSESALCEMFGVARSSVREALRVLEEKGLIEIRHGLRSRVNPPEQWQFLDDQILRVRRENGTMPPFVRDLFEARAIIECEVAALAAQRATPDDLRLLEASVEQMENTAADQAAFVETDFEFHRQLFQTAGNRVLMRVLRPTRELLEYTFEQKTAGSAPDTMIADHRAIAEAVRAKDASGAREAMRRHLLFPELGAARENGSR